MPGCNKNIGTKDLSDGVWVWPEGFEHYIRKHHVKPGAEFIRHTITHRPPFRIVRKSSFLDDLARHPIDDSKFFKDGHKVAARIVDWWRRR